MATTGMVHHCSIPYYHQTGLAGIPLQICAILIQLQNANPLTLSHTKKSDGGCSKFSKNVFFSPLSIATTAPAVIRPRCVMGTMLEFQPLVHEFWDVTVRSFQSLTCSAIEKLCDVIGRLVALGSNFLLINVSCDL